MNDRQESEAEAQDEKLQVDREKLGDLDVPDEASEDVKGGIATGDVNADTHPERR